MADPVVTFPPPPFRSQFLDANGKVGREWYVWLGRVYTLLGGDSGSSVAGAVEGVVLSPSDQQNLMFALAAPKEDLVEIKEAIAQAQAIAWQALAKADAANDTDSAALNIVAGLGISVDVNDGIITISNTGVLRVLEGDGTVTVDNTNPQNPQLSVNQPALDINLLGGAPLRVTGGGTGLTTLGGPFTALSVSSDGTELFYRQPPTVDWRFFFGDANPVVVYSIPNNRCVRRVQVAVETAFDGVGASISVGTTGNPQSLMAANQIFPADVGSYQTNPGVTYATATDIVLTINPGTGGTQGSGVLTLELQSSRA